MPLNTYDMLQMITNVASMQPSSSIAITLSVNDYGHGSLEHGASNPTRSVCGAPGMIDIYQLSTLFALVL